MLAYPVHITTAGLGCKRKAARATSNPIFSFSMLRSVITASKTWPSARIFSAPAQLFAVRTAYPSRSNTICNVSATLFSSSTIRREGFRAIERVFIGFVKLLYSSEHMERSCWLSLPRRLRSMFSAGGIAGHQQADDFPYLIHFQGLKAAIIHAQSQSSAQTLYVGI